MKKLIYLILALIILTGVYLGIKNLQKSKRGEEVKMVLNKKVLMVIASQNFRDEEYQKPREVLERQGVEVKVASSQKGERVGMLGMKVAPDLLLDEVNLDEFDGIVFVGGIGASEYFHSEKALSLAKEAEGKNKVIAAICIAPSILANAGVLSGKKATVYPSEAGNLKAKGANYTGEDVTLDGKIVTASGPSAAPEFGRKILEVLSQ